MPLGPLYNNRHTLLLSEEIDSNSGAKCKNTREMTHASSPENLAALPCEHASCRHRALLFSNLCTCHHGIDVHRPEWSDIALQNASIVSWQATWLRPAGLLILLSIAPAEISYAMTTAATVLRSYRAHTTVRDTSCSPGNDGNFNCSCRDSSSQPVKGKSILWPPRHCTAAAVEGQ